MTRPDHISAPTEGGTEPPPDGIVAWRICRSSRSAIPTGASRRSSICCRRRRSSSSETSGRFRMSRTNPQFNKDTLPAALGAYQIAYDHGGARRLARRRATLPADVNGFWTNESFRQLLRRLRAAEPFHAGLELLLARGGRRRCAIMCSEAVCMALPSPHCRRLPHRRRRGQFSTSWARVDGSRRT